MRILNGNISWTGEDIRDGGDQGRVEIGLEQLRLMEGSRSVSTPVDKETIAEEGEHELDRGESIVYRGLVARPNHLAQHW